MKIIENPSKHILKTGHKDLTLFFLGCGSAFSRLHNQNNLLVLKDDEHLLIDCGAKCPQALYEAGIESEEIKNIHITHSHADHIGGLEELALKGRYITGIKPKIFVTEEYEELLWNYSLMGGSGFNEVGVENPLKFSDFFNVYRPQFREEYARDLYEFSISSLNVKLVRTMHIPEMAKNWQESVWSTGAILDDRILFTGDSRYDPDLILDFDKIFNFEAIFHDSQFFTGGVHAGIDELNRLPEAIKKKTFLMHYSDNWRQFEKKVSEFGFAGFVEQQKLYIFD